MAVWVKNQNNNIRIGKHAWGSVIVGRAPDNSGYIREPKKITKAWIGGPDNKPILVLEKYLHGYTKVDSVLPEDCVNIIDNTSVIYTGPDGIPKMHIFATVGTTYGKHYAYYLDGTDRVVELPKPNTSNNVRGAVVYDGCIYVDCIKANSTERMLVKWKDGDTSWTPVYTGGIFKADIAGGMVVYDNCIYMIDNGGKYYVWDGSKMSSFSTFPNKEYQRGGIVVLNDAIYVFGGIHTGNDVYKYDKLNGWTTLYSQNSTTTTGDIKYRIPMWFNRGIAVKHSNEVYLISSENITADKYIYKFDGEHYEKLNDLFIKTTALGDSGTYGISDGFGGSYKDRIYLMGGNQRPTFIGYMETDFIPDSFYSNKLTGMTGPDNITDIQSTPEYYAQLVLGASGSDLQWLAGDPYDDDGNPVTLSDYIIIEVDSSNHNHCTITNIPDGNYYFDLFAYVDTISEGGTNTSKTIHVGTTTRPETLIINKSQIDRSNDLGPIITDSSQGIAYSEYYYIHVLPRNSTSYLEDYKIGVRVNDPNVYLNSENWYIEFEDLSMDNLLNISVINGYDADCSLTLSLIYKETGNVVYQYIYGLQITTIVHMSDIYYTGGGLYRDDFRFDNDKLYMNGTYGTTQNLTFSLLPENAYGKENIPINIRKISGDLTLIFNEYYSSGPIYNGQKLKITANSTTNGIIEISADDGDNIITRTLYVYAEIVSPQDSYFLDVANSGYDVNPPTRFTNLNQLSHPLIYKRYYQSDAVQIGDYVKCRGSDDVYRVISYNINTRKYLIRRLSDNYEKYAFSGGSYGNIYHIGNGVYFRTNEITWSSSNTNIFTVQIVNDPSISGLDDSWWKITPISNGTATLTAVFNDDGVNKTLTYQVTVDVSEVYPSGIIIRDASDNEITELTFTDNPEESKIIKVYLTPSGHDVYNPPSGYYVGYASSSNTNIATTSQQTLEFRIGTNSYYNRPVSIINGYTAGTCDITFTFTDPNGNVVTKTLRVNNNIPQDRHITSVFFKGANDNDYVASGTINTDFWYEPEYDDGGNDPIDI